VDPFSEVSQINHYSPFGLNLEGNWNGAAGAYKKQYNGKEWDDDLGINLNDYGARWYDPAIGRWGSIDPLSEKYSRHSPYNYVMNNPMNNIDPNGKNTVFVNAGTGEQIGETVDNLEDAIVIVSGNKADDFKKEFNGTKKKNDNDVKNLRKKYGIITYILGGLKKMFKQSMSTILTNPYVLDRSLNPMGFHPEFGGMATISQDPETGNYIISFDESYKGDDGNGGDPTSVVLDPLRNSVSGHVHPEQDYDEWYYISDPTSYHMTIQKNGQIFYVTKEATGNLEIPSGADYNNHESRQSNHPDGFPSWMYSAIITKKNIILYQHWANGNQEIKIDIKFFKK